MQIAATEKVVLAQGSMPNAEPSAVAWGAVIAGAVVAMVTSMVLIMLGSGLGFVAVSPWTADADTAKAIGIGAVVWLVAMQLVSAALGGFVGGRLRTRWSASPDEVFFRDTAHGLLVWGVATLVTAVLFTYAATSVVSGVARVGATAASAGVAATGLGAAALLKGEAAKGTPMNEADSGARPARSAYYGDMMLRSDRPAAEPESAQLRGEFARLIAMGMTQDLSKADLDHMAQTIATRTGISQTEAEQRVKTVMSQAKQEATEAEQKVRAAADQARKAAAHMSLWMVISLLVGAFVASYAATIGGRMRDQP